MATSILLVATILAACTEGSADLATLQRDAASALRLVTTTQVNVAPSGARSDAMFDAYTVREADAWRL